MQYGKNECEPRRILCDELVEAKRYIFLLASHPIEISCAQPYCRFCCTGEAVSFGGSSQWTVFDNEGRRKYLNPVERARVLESADRADPLARSLCYFLLFTGCRISEAIGVRREHVAEAEGGVWVRTLKRRRSVYRRVPLPPFMMKMLGDLTPGLDGKLWDVHRTTAWRWIKSITEDASVRGLMASARGLRHSFAIHAASRHVPPYSLQRFMGHASIETTLIYVDAVGAEEREFANRMW